jgi:uncharacterized protein (TIGR01319 family)
MSSEEESYLIVDIDSRTTKAILVVRTASGYKLGGVSETITTMEAPVLDVTEGVKTALAGLEGSTGKKILDGDSPSAAHRFMASSSTGGGLHMVVGGVTNIISGESAQRAALGAGALLMDQFSKDDSRPNFEKIARLRAVKPDIMLMAGGTDGGAVTQVLEMAGLVNTADVKPRFGEEYQLPFIYAGNVEIRDQVKMVLGEKQYATRMVENVRPVISEENLGPAREGIYDAYMEHVIVHSPGYDELIRWTEEPLLPTQAAVGKLLYAYAGARAVNLIGVDVGGETTDVYSVFNGIFNRSLNADIGITYGVMNIVKETGLGNVMRWLPPGMGEKEVRNTVGNMMLHEYETLSPEQMIVQAAVAREAVRLGLEKHKGIASRLKGTLVGRTLSDMFDQALEKTIIDLFKTHVVVGKGKVFRDQPALESAMILIDSLEPMGVTEIKVDQSSIMPHLGNLLGVNHDAALQILVEESLTSLATCAAPTGKAREGEEAITVQLTMDGSEMVESVQVGDIRIVPLGSDEVAEATFTPHRRLDLGAGRGKQVKKQVQGGEVGLLLDARGRSLNRFRKTPEAPKRP